MAKKKKTPQPDADGWVSKGIYKTRRKTISPEEFEKHYLDKLANPKTIHEWLNDWLSHLADRIRPHLDDSGHTEYALDLGDGWQGYRLADDLPDSVRDPVLDAIDCMNEVRVLSGHIGEDNTLTGDLVWVVNTAFRLGRLTEKMKIRPFEPLVAQRRASNAGIEKINKCRPSSEKLKREAEEAIESAKAEYPDRENDSNFIKTKAAKSLDIKKRALNTRLSK